MTSGIKEDLSKLKDALKDIFMNQETQCGLDVISLQLDVEIQHNPNQNLCRIFFVGIGNLILMVFLFFTKLQRA